MKSSDLIKLIQADGWAQHFMLYFSPVLFRRRQ